MSAAYSEKMAAGRVKARETLRLAVEERLASQRMTSRCACGWSHSGTAREAIEAAGAHRRTCEGLQPIEPPSQPPKPTRLCACGCGEEVKRGRKFVFGHQARTPAALARAAAMGRANTISP